MADVNVGILGLGRVGASLGLALKRYTEKGGGHTFIVAGYDNIPDNVKVAQNMKAVDEVKSRPEEVTRNKDIIFVTLATHEAELVYPLIANDIRQGVVVFDFSPIKQKMMQLAERLLSPKGHVMSVAAMVNPKYLFHGVLDTEHASADYFERGVLMVMPSVKADKDAIALATDISNILGSIPHFYDVNEYDVLSTAVEALPSLLGAVAFYSLFKTSGWTDMVRVSNTDFAMLTHSLYDRHPDDLRAVWMNGSVDLARHLDGVIQNLTQIRSALLNKDEKAMTAFLDETSAEYELWLNRRMKPEWELEEKLKPETQTFRGLMRSMLGGFVVGGDRKDDKKK
ncbi:MAG: prephenate dehydrogenase/arogenate dehydrogenase family protein [bacterium]|nr:prephenate dehydrogenase/arogenate dehydrogenase family protein [bacterium]